MKAQLSMADKFKARYALILGEVEVREGKIILRDMVAGKQEIIPLKDAVKEVIKKIGTEKLDTYDPSQDLLVAKKTLRPEEELLVENVDC
jgi:histidyl-tRNA synthetase